MACSKKATFQFGGGNRRQSRPHTFDGPIANVNLSAQRSFALPKLGEAARFEIRGELFNLFNA